MDEKSILLYVAILIGYLLSFFCGWLFCKYRTARSTGDSGICDQLSRDLEEDKRRIESSQTELNGVIDEGERIKDILGQYINTAEKESESK